MQYRGTADSFSLAVVRANRPKDTSTAQRRPGGEKRRGVEGQIAVYPSLLADAWYASEGGAGRLTVTCLRLRTPLVSTIINYYRD